MPVADKTVTVAFSTKTQYHLRLLLQETAVSNANNTSTITYTLTMYTDSGSYTGYSDYKSTWYLQFDGVNEKSGTFYDFNTSAASSASVTLATGTKTITHGTDGTKTLSFKANVSVNSGTFSPGTATINSTWALTAIPRSPSTVSIPSGTHYVGDAITITIGDIASSSYTHKLRYVINSKSGDIGTVAAGSSTKSWTPSISTFSTTSSTISGKIYCATYSGTTQVGSETSCNITLTLQNSTVSVSAGTHYIGSAMTISIDRHGRTGYTHTLRYVFGNKSGTIATGVGTSKSWTPPASLFDASSYSGTIYCKTYSGDSVVGPESSVSVTLSVQAKSTFGTLTPSTKYANESITIPITSNNTLYTHKLQYTYSGTTTGIASNVGTSYTWTPPLSVFASTSTSVSVTLKLITYGSSTKIGESTTTVTLNMPNSSVNAVTGTHYVGSALTLSLSYRNSNYTHTLSYYYSQSSPAKSGTIATGVKASTSWTPSFDTWYNASYNSNNQTNVTIRCTTYSGSTQIGPVSTQTVTITNPVSSGFSVTGSTIVGEQMDASWTRKVSNVTHNVQVVYSNHNSQVVTGAATSASWSLDVSRYAGYVTDSGTITVSVRLNTMGNGHILGTSSVSKTLTFPDSVNPTVSSGWASVGYDNSGTAASSITAMLQGYSKAKITIDTSKISTKYSATVSSYSVKIGTTTETFSASPYTFTKTLGTSGAQSCDVTVYDSRGRSATSTISFTVLAYSPPQLTSASVFRCDDLGSADDAGTYYKVAIAFTCSAASPNGNNTATAKVERKSGGSYVTDGDNLTSPVSQVYGSGLISTTQSYTIRITLTDAIGRTSVTTYSIPTESVAFNIKDGGAGAAFFGYANDDGVLKVFGDIVADDMTSNGSAVLTLADHPFRVAKKDATAGVATNFTIANNGRAVIFFMSAYTACRDIFLVACNSSGSVYHTKVLSASGLTTSNSENTLTITPQYGTYMAAIAFTGTIS